MDPEEQQQQARSASTGSGDAADPAPKPKRSKGRYEHPPDPAGLDLATKVSALAATGASDIAAALAKVAKYAAAAKGGDKYEETGEERDQLVSAIHDVRTALAATKKANPGDTQLGSIAPDVYHYLQDVAPYYFQSRNVDVLEEFKEKPPKGSPEKISKKLTDTRTCNITCLAMALENLGLGPGNYSPQATVERVASYFMNEQENAAQIGVAAGEKTGLADADHQVKGKGLEGLRLPDFLELACIAEKCTPQSTFQEINDARWAVWNEITDFGFLKHVAAKFGVAMRTEKLKDASGTDISSALRKFGKQHRLKTKTHAGVEDMVEARNKGDAKYAAEQAAIDADTGPIDVDQYKAAVTEQVGPSLDAGKAIVVHLSGHYVKLQSIDDAGIVVDDPGSKTKSNRRVLWGEARAMGYFQHWYLFG